MAKNDKTSPDLASLAARALKKPGSLKKSEIKSLAASVLTQAADTVKDLVAAVLPVQSAEPKAAAKPKTAKKPAARPAAKTRVAKAAVPKAKQTSATAKPVAAKPAKESAAAKAARPAPRRAPAKKPA